MADNDTTLDASGSTVTYASDDISSVKYPRVKQALGADGTFRRDDPGESTASVTISAASTNATSLKASAGHVEYIIASNLNASARYLKLYNKASAPTVGTDTPVMVIRLPAAGQVEISFNRPPYFSLGIAWALTSGIAHADTGAVSASEHAVNIGYN